MRVLMLAIGQKCFLLLVLLLLLFLPLLGPTSARLGERVGLMSFCSSGERNSSREGTGRGHSQCFKGEFHDRRTFGPWAAIRVLSLSQSLTVRNPWGTGVSDKKKYPVRTVRAPALVHVFFFPVRKGTKTIFNITFPCRVDELM
ncbi:hypothetical protein LZ30DRAFT_697649 [Colletotrichum cereale]|nr:hypothetical protein LZ30DRAFT_697649 [Colletotrichum cereale]